MAKFGPRCKVPPGGTGVRGMQVGRRTVLGGVLALPWVQVAQGQVAHRISVVHFNDFHSRHEAVDAQTLTCTAGATCFGGSARLAAALHGLRADAEADGRGVLLLDGGDQFQGSLFYTAHRGLAELAVQHAIGVDAMVLGNHEWDGGPAALGQYVTLAQFPVLAANVVTGEPSLQRLRPYAMFDRAGLRIAVVGVTTTEALVTSSPGPGVQITDPAAALAAAAAAARGEGAQFVIALSHLGLAADLALTGVPVVIGAHSHLLLSNTEPGAVGPHPTRSPGGALVVQAGAYGRYAGRLDLDIGADGTVLGHGGAVAHVGLDGPADPSVAAIVAAYGRPLAAVRVAVIGHVPAALDHVSCRLGPCPLGALVTDAMRRAAPGADVAIMNAGGLRTGLPAGAITLGQVLDMMPFGNALATLELSGVDLAATILHGDGLRTRGGYPQLSGARVVDGRVELGGPDAWRPIDPAATYRIVTNNFLRGGGDGYVVLRDRAIRPYDLGPGLAETVARALDGS